MQKPSKDQTKNIDELKNTAAENDEEYIEDDEWWMSYDSGVPAEDITEQLLKAKEELAASKRGYSKLG
nr:hypothetical protein [Rickettsia endosymbiont of Ceutorhynchus assimilis]